MKKNKKPTRVNSIEVVKFRGLEDVTINFGKRITAICGKNGTSKSTILGILAQVFSFREDVSVEPSVKLTDYKTLTGRGFKSEFSEHFRISEKHDKAGDMQVKLSIYDGYTGVTPSNLELRAYNSSDRSKIRTIVRGNTTVEGKNESRNMTHPVIFLSLKRLLPIPSRDKYLVTESDFYNENKSEIAGMYGDLTGKRKSTIITGTSGTINSMVMHSDNYDHESVSVGEDNIGQIVQALFSFRNLKKEYSSYKGGLLLIDEADAGLFPAAQESLISKLEKECKNLDLQVVFTTHSPTLIEALHKKEQEDREGNYKVIYLTDSHGKLEAKEDYTWVKINADLHTKSLILGNKLALPLVNVYFEDKQAYQLYSSIVRKRKITAITKTMKNISLGCDKYIDLILCKVPEFSEKSVIVLDGDVAKNIKEKNKSVLKAKNLVLLPTHLAPDQLLFEFLYNLPANDDFWANNPYEFKKPVFERIAGDIINRLQIFVDGEIDLLDYLKEDNPQGKARLREIFKAFSTNEEIENLISGPIKYNPYAVWAKKNADEASKFIDNITKALRFVLINGHYVSTSQADSYLDEN